MSGTNMSDVLGEVFNTKTASATAEDLEKTAQLDFFTGLCKEQGIDVHALTDPQIEQLWKVAMDMRKEAGELPPAFAKKDDDKGEKKKDEKKGDDKEKEAAAKAVAAEAEFNEKRAAAVKVAEADMMGRIMAHSFTQELQKIAEKDGGFPFPPKKDGDDKGDKGDAKKDDKDGEKKEASAADRVAALVRSFQEKTATAAPAAAEGSSTTPNFDEVAAYRAIDLLKEAGVDAELAHNKVSAAYTLGLKDSVKLASAPDAKAGLEIRALEICEAAGFQVNWA